MVLTGQTCDDSKSEIPYKSTRAFARENMQTELPRIPLHSGMNVVDESQHTMVEMQSTLEDMINKQIILVYLPAFLCMYTERLSSSSNTVMTICSVAV